MVAKQSCSFIRQEHTIATSQLHRPQLTSAEEGKWNTELRNEITYKVTTNQ